MLYVLRRDILMCAGEKGSSKNQLLHEPCMCSVCLYLERERTPGGMTCSIEYLRIIFCIQMRIHV